MRNTRLIIALYRDLSTGMGKFLMFHVKRFDKKAKNFTPTSVIHTESGLQRFCKYGQMDIEKLYNVSRG